MCGPPTHNTVSKGLWEHPTCPAAGCDRDSCSYNSMVRAAAAGRFDAVEQLGIFAKSPSLAIRAHQEGMLRLVFAESTTTKATPKMGFLLRATEIARTPSVLDFATNLAAFAKRFKHSRFTTKLWVHLLP